MSRASDFVEALAAAADNTAAVAVTVPPPWNGPKLHAEVLPNGWCKLVAQNTTYEVPPQVVLAFAAWVQATFA